jgi:hypothetical protein
MLLKTLKKYQVPIEYLHDSKIENCNEDIKIAFGSVINEVFDSVMSVSKINHKVLPFLVYNYEEMNLGVKFGQSAIEQNYSDFFKKSFADETQRSGCFDLIAYNQASNFVMDISFDTCSVTSKYQRNSTVIFLFLAYTMYFQEIGFPAQTTLGLNVKLTKDNNVVFEKHYSINKTQSFLNNSSNNSAKLRQDFVVNMAEALSNSTKECIEQIITDINQIIAESKRE